MYRRWKMLHNQTRNRHFGQKLSHILLRTNLHHMSMYVCDRADVNVCDQFFWMPLHHAAHAGYLEIVDVLLKAGASIDAPSLSGGTALVRAIESAKPSCVDFLIRAGASVNAKSMKGKDQSMCEKSLN